MANIEIETSSDSVEEVQEALGAEVEIEELQPGTTEEQPEEKPDKEKPSAGKEEPEDAAAEVTEEEEAEKKDETEEEKPVVKKAVPQTVPRARLNEEIRKRKDLEKQLSERPAPKAEATPESTEPQTYSGKVEPKIEDFVNNEKFDDPYAAFTKAHGSWVREETLAEVAAKETQKQIDAEREKLVGAFNKHVKTAIQERIPDYEDVVPGSDVQISGLMERRIFKSPYGPDMLYALAQDPDRAAEIMAMEIDDQVEAMIDLESEIKAAAPAPKATAEDTNRGGPPRKQIPARKSSAAPLPPSRIKSAGPGPKSERELAGPEDRTGIDIDFNPELERLERAKRKT